MHMRFRSLSFLLLSSGLLLFAPLASAQTNGADCRNLVVNHTYAGNFTGYLNLPVYMNNPDDGTVGVVPNAGAGKITFLPGGRITNTETLMIGMLGGHKDTVITGKYTLAWDRKANPAVCVGAIHASDGSTSYDFQLIVPANADRIEMIHTNTGLIVGTSMFPMSFPACHNSSMTGTYTYNSTGWAIASPTTPPDQLLAAYIPGAMSGAMHFYPSVPPDSTTFSDAPAGAGSVQAWDGLSVNGAILTRTMTGWYKISRDCTLTLVLLDNIGYPPFHIEGFVGRGSDTVYAVNTDTVDPDGSGPPVFLMPITLSHSKYVNDRD
jgi:hypothetical protein